MSTTIAITTSAISTPSPPSGNTNTILIVVVIVLSLVCSGLVSLSVYVYNRAGDPPKKKKKKANKKKNNSIEMTNRKSSGKNEIEIKIEPDATDYKPMAQRTDVRLSTERSEVSTSKMGSAVYGKPADNGIFEAVLVGDVEIRERLGGGAFGDVYVGIWNGTTQVALKKLKGGDQTKEFENEMSLLKKLNHPHVVRFFGIFKSNSEFYLVTELVGKQPGVRETLKISDLLYMYSIRNSHLQFHRAAGIANGMDYLEQHKIVHRDLGARNCLITQLDDQYIVKVADLGLSRMVDDYYASVESTFPVKWSPPEVIDRRLFSAASDVWSFGVTLWEIFEFGTLPYPGMNNLETVEYVRKGGRLSQPETCPDDVYSLMYSCWNVDPSKRPSFKVLFNKLTSLKGNYEHTSVLQSGNTTMSGDAEAYYNNK